LLPCQFNLLLTERSQPPLDLLAALGRGVRLLQTDPRLLSTDPCLLLPQYSLVLT
jgi:hypothetical protein